MKKRFLFSTLVLTVFTVSCGSQPKQEVKPTSVDIDRDSMELVVDGSHQLVATVLPADATNKTVTWSVEPAGFASVSNDGTVVGLSIGNCVVTATTVNGLTDTCNVSVVPAVTDDINLNKSSGLDFSSGSGEVTAKDGRSNDVVFNYSEAKNASDKLVSLAKNGIFSNKTILKGVTSIKVNFTGNLSVRYGYIKTDYCEPVALTSGTALTFKSSKRTNYVELVAGEGGAVIESLEYLVKGSANNPWDGQAEWNKETEELTVPQGPNWEKNLTYYSIPEGKISDNFAVEWTMVGDIAETPESTVNGGIMLRDEEQTQVALGVNKSHGVVFCDCNHWSSPAWINYSNKSYQHPVDGKTTFRLERYVISGQDRAYYRAFVNGHLYEYLGETKPSSNYDDQQSKFYNTTLSSRVKLPIVSIGFGTENVGPMVFKDFKYEPLESAPIVVNIDECGVNSAHYSVGESSVYMHNTSGKWFYEQGHRPAAISTEAVPAGTTLNAGEQIIVEADIQRVLTDADNDTLQADGGWSDPHGLLIKEGGLENKLVVDDSVSHKVFMGMKSQQGGYTLSWGTNKSGTQTKADWDVNREFVSKKNSTDVFKYKDVYGRYLEDANRVRWVAERDTDNRLIVKMYFKNDAGEWVEEENAKTFNTFSNQLTFYLTANSNSSTYFHNISIIKKAI